MKSRATRRLEKELELIRREFPEEYKVTVPNDEELLWLVEFNGPPESIYEGERFTLKFTFEETYVIII